MNINAMTENNNILLSKLPYVSPCTLLVQVGATQMLASSPEIHITDTKVDTNCDALVREENGEWDVWDESYYNE